VASPLSHPASQTVDPAELPPAGEVMTSEALSRLKACRLSFIQSLLRRMIRERWQIERVRWELDDEGRGLAVYRIAAPAHAWHLIIFSDHLLEDEQEERIVATRWDVMAALVEGDLADERIEALRAQIPFVIDGRMDPDCLMWCRANRSLRVFEHTVDRLSDGLQPDFDLVAEAGYLMRTLDFRANGLNGSRPLLAHSREHPLRGPYFAQMLGSFVIRQFSFDLVEDLARRRSPGAATLRGDVARYLGVGNSSGVGIVLFLLAQPHLLNRWLELRFTALARVRARPSNEQPGRDRFDALLERRIRYAEEDETDYKGAFTPGATVARELGDVGALLGGVAATTWGAVLDRVAETIDPEALQVLHALLIEAHPELTDDLAEHLVVEELPGRPPAMTAGAMLELLEREFGWALASPADDPDERYFFWYKSEENEEPRLGVRGMEFGEDLTIDTVGDAHRLAAALRSLPSETPLAEVLLRNPGTRQMAERTWAAGGQRYHTPHLNSIARSFWPIDSIRTVLSGLYGLEKLGPMSDLWVRAVMMQGAPTAVEIAAGTSEDWMYPARPRA
jgi:hypothetical protein